jgi:hypothetical protein
MAYGLLNVVINVLYITKLMCSPSPIIQSPVYDHFICCMGRSHYLTDPAWSRVLDAIGRFLASNSIVGRVFTAGTT